MFQHVDLIGLGGTGSKLVTDLVRLLLFSSNIEKGLTLNLFDGDIIEPKNLTRAFNNSGVTQAKVEHIKNELIAQFDDQLAEKEFNIDAYPKYIDKAFYSNVLENRSRRSKTLCIAAVDNDDTRKQLLQAIEEKDRWVMFVSPGNEESYGQVISWLKEGKTATEYSPLKLYPQLEEADPKYNPGSCAYQATSAPQLLTTNMMAATETLNQVSLMLLTGLYYDYVGFDNYKADRTPGKLLQIKDATLPVQQ